MIVLDYIFMLGLLPLLTIFCILAVFTVSSFFYRPKCRDEAEPTRLAVVIPAHDEEHSIAGTIRAIRQTDYPSDLLCITVICDNCSDKTADVARAEDVVVIERFDACRKGKGWALDWFCRNHQDLYLDTDGVVFLDADSQPDATMLKQLNSSLSHPDVSVVQGFNGVGNPYQSWRTGLITISFNIFNHLRMAASGVLFHTSTLKGLGMAFQPELLARYGWPAHSMVEDLEMSLILQKDGIAIHYNPEAIVTSELAVSGKQAVNQRRRWEGGRFQLIAELLPALTKKILTGKPQALPVFFELFVPPLSLTAAMLMLWSILSLFFYPLALPLITVFWGCLLCYIVAAQLQRNLSLRLWMTLFSAPFFLLWKMWLYFGMIFSNSPDGWLSSRVKAGRAK